MSHMLAIAKKELRGYFLSPIALVFLGSFLLITLFSFFTGADFWSRNLADARPLFEVLPIALIFLVGALTMRLWSEEQKLGTLEILLTLPVSVRSLVAGKFVAALSLVILALLLTVQVPILISMQGDLDWGPVVGGYIGAALLAGAYIAIGLCVSSSTKNQVVALIVTWLACGALYLVGSDTITRFAPVATAEILRAIGTGSRFESIGRGVLDVRDVVYYLSLTVTFLVLNAVLLSSKGWSAGAKTRGLRFNAKAMTGLVALNFLALNIWLADVRTVRADLTERQEFTISDVTEDLIGGLHAPLLIRGYFSERSHPLLDPLVPQIRDLIEEYGALSGGKVRAEFVDPKTDPEIEQEANQSYGIKSFPFQVASRYEAGVVNSYFSILIKYGDQYETLDFRDLIEIRADSTGEPEVKLRNLEYDLTRTVKKVAYGFQTLEAVFADLNEQVEFKAYVSPATLPENYKEVPERLDRVLKEIEASSAAFKWSVIDPLSAENQGMPETLYQQFGLRPMATNLFGDERFYLHLILRVGDRYERILPAEGMAEADIKNEVVAALKRSTPGFLKTVGLVKPKVEAPPQQFPGQPPAPPQEMTRILTQQLGENYSVRDTDLSTGRVPGDVDVLMVVAPSGLDDTALFAIDQYLMRGGSVVMMAGNYELDLASARTRRGLSVKKVDSGTESLLAAYGIAVEDGMVMDQQNERFPVPVERNLGGFRVQQIQLVNYPFFVDIRSDGMDKDSPILAGIPGVTLQWTSPLTVTTPKTPEGEDAAAAPREVIELLRSTSNAWVASTTEVQPDFDTYPEAGFPQGEEMESKLLAVAVTGKFWSAFRDKANPTYGAGETGDRTGRTVKSSPDNARLVVVGSSNFINDAVLGISQQGGGERGQSNLQLVENLLDWSVSDVDLLTIRSRGTFARTLIPLEPTDRRQIEGLSYGVGLLALFLIVGTIWGTRRRMRPIDLGGEPRSPASGLGTASEARS